MRGRSGTVGVFAACSGQQLAQQMQQSNPELVEQLRSQMRGQSNTTSSSDNTTANDQSQPGSFTFLAEQSVHEFCVNDVYYILL